MLSQEMVGAQQFSTKIGAVVRSILWACRQSPGAKVLVFSQFRPILSIVSRALAANGVEHRHLDGNLRERASALELFQDPGSRVRALLMSLRHDASGLTLHAAQYVVLVEPSLNPAIEDQAISRVHRRGQTRSTFVYRYAAPAFRLVLPSVPTPSPVQVPGRPVDRGEDYRDPASSTGADAAAAG